MKSSTEFNQVANRKLEELQDHVEELISSAEVDLLDETLSIQLESGQQYIINKHNPTQQIWVASPQSGAHHFRFDNEKCQWINVRTGEPLDELIKNELEIYAA